MKSDPHSLPRSVIRSKAMEFAKKEIQVQKEEFCELGIMADWNSQSATYRTLGMVRVGWSEFTLINR